MLSQQQFDAVVSMVVETGQRPADSGSRCSCFDCVWLPQLQEYLNEWYYGEETTTERISKEVAVEEFARQRKYAAQVLKALQEYSGQDTLDVNEHEPEQPTEPEQGDVN